MAASQTIKFEYLNSSNVWTEPATHRNNSTVILCKIIKALNNPSVAEIFMNNRSKDTSATDADAKGTLTSLLTDFSEIRLTDQSTGMILFRGRVYEHKSHYDNQYGSTLKVLAKDHLQELAEYPIDDAPPALRNIIIDPTSSVAYFNSYGKVINRIASQLSIEGFDFSDTTKFEASHAFTSEDLKTGSINDANKYYWDVATGKQFALQVIHDFSQQDPHDNPAEQHFGFDYYVDPNFTSTSTNHVPKPHFNYFKRNTRPGTNQSTTANPVRHGFTVEYPFSGGTKANDQKRFMYSDAEFNTPQDSLYTNAVVHFEESGEGDGDLADDGEVRSNRKHTNSFELIEGHVKNFSKNSNDELTETEFKDRRMYFRLQDGIGTNGRPNDPKIPLLLYRKDPATGGSQIPCGTLHYVSDNGAGNAILVSNIYEQPDTAGESDTPIKTHTYIDDLGGQQKFEVWSESPFTSTTDIELYVTKAIPSGTNFQFPSYNTGTASQSGSTITGSGTIWTDAMIGSTFTFASGAGGGTITDRSSNTSITVETSENVNSSSYVLGTPHIVIDPPTCRASSKFNMKKPLRIQAQGIDSHDVIRKQIVAKLDRYSRATVTTANVRISRYPYTKYVVSAANVSRSTNVLTFSNNAFQNELYKLNNSDSNGIATNDARTFGAKKGMVIAELHSTGAVKRYSFISAFPSSTQITYGANETNTLSLDNPAEYAPIDTSNDVALFVPVEPGHTVRIRNHVWGKDYDILVQKITYDTAPAAINSSIEGVGLDTNDAGVPSTHRMSFARSRVAGGTSDKGYTPNIPRGQQKWSISDGTISATDHNTIAITSTALATTGAFTIGGAVKGFVTVVTGDGRRYHMSTGNIDLPTSGATDARYHAHVLYFRPSSPSMTGGSASLQVKAKSTNTSPPGATEIYSKIAHKDDIIIGWAKADTDTDGKAILHFDGDVFGSSGQLDIDGDGTAAATGAIASNRLKSALLKKGARAWTSNISIRGTAYNQIVWDNGTANTDAVLAFADGSDTITILDGTKTSGLSDNQSYYMYLDGVSGNVTPSFSTTHSDAVGDSKILLAIVVIGDSNKGAKPTILPFNSKVPTINAVAIAADSITTDSLQALSISAGKIQATAIDGKTITGATIRTSESGNRYVLDSNDAKFYGVSGDTPSIYFYNDVGGSTINKYRFRSTAGYVYENYFDDLYFWMSSNYHVNAFNNGNTDWGTSSYRWKDGYFAGDVYYDGGNTGSDSRLKSNIADFTNADSLAFINSLTPRKFNKHGGDTLHYGLVAQEVEAALTDLGIDKTKLGLIKIPTEETSDITRDTVDSTTGEITGNSTAAEANMRTLNYEQLIAPLIGAVKELKRRIEVLEAE